MYCKLTTIKWKKKRDLHVIILRPEYPEPLVAHLLAHELTHIALEAEARSEGRNKWFSTTAASRETAIRSMAAEIMRYERAGFNNDNVAGVFVEMIGGAASFLFNAPLDMLIEERLRKRLPDLDLASSEPYGNDCVLVSLLEGRPLLEFNDYQMVELLLVPTREHEIDSLSRPRNVVLNRYAAVVGNVVVVQDFCDRQQRLLP